MKNGQQRARCWAGAKQPWGRIIAFVLPSSQLQRGIKQPGMQQTLCCLPRPWETGRNKWCSRECYVAVLYLCCKPLHLSCVLIMLQSSPVRQAKQYIKIIPSVRKQSHIFGKTQCSHLKAASENVVRKLRWLFKKWGAGCKLDGMLLLQLQFVLGAGAACLLVQNRGLGSNLGWPGVSTSVLWLWWGFPKSLYLLSCNC